LPVHRRGHDEPGHGARRGGARSGGRGPAAGQSGWHDSWLAAIYEVIAVAGVLLAVLSCAKADAGDEVDELAEPSYVETGPCVGLGNAPDPSFKAAPDGALKFQAL
jgi:hypothetical protein